MSEKSKKFWQDQITRKGEIVVPDLLDDWAKVATQDLRDESDRYFTELQAERASAAKLVEALTKIHKMRKTDKYWDGETMTKIAYLGIAAHKKGGVQNPLTLWQRCNALGDMEVDFVRMRQTPLGDFWIGKENCHLTTVHKDEEDDILYGTVWLSEAIVSSFEKIKKGGASNG